MTTHRHDPADAPESRDEFWGEHTEWTPRPVRSTERAGIGATLGRWWDALLGGGAVAERAHGRPGSSSAPADEPERHIDRSPIADRPHQDHGGDDLDDDLGDGPWELEPEPQPTRHPGVDPLLARLGGLAVIVTLAAPLVVGFTASGADSQATDSLLSTISPTPTAEFAEPATTVAAAATASAATSDPAAATTASGSTPDTMATASAAAATVDDGDGDADAEASAPSSAFAAALEESTDPEPAATTPAVTTPPCGSRYELAAGDYWIRIADAGGVSLAELLAVNDSSVDTVLVPGRSICLPVGAATPAPPATAAPAPTAPATTAPANRPSTTTTATPAPTTTAPSRPAAVPRSQAVAIIRDVWPDDLEERAIEIAWRESNHRSNVNNYCCYGLFQIHWTAHRSWLATIGVTSASQLFDPVVNANAAYLLYQRSGGFGPWGG